MPNTDTHLIPRNKNDFKRLLRDAITVFTVVVAAYGGSSVAQDSKVERLEATIERQSSKIERLERRVDALTRELERK